MSGSFDEQPMDEKVSTGSSWGFAAAVVILAGAAVGLALYLRPSPKTETARAAGEAASASSPHVVAKDPKEAGRYLVIVGGCNDCHTPGFMEKGMRVPEAEWLTGVPLGWRGPWGTTYAANLRLSVQSADENMWVKMMSMRDARPPMPWPSLHVMAEADLRAIYQYTRSLGPKGEMMPAALPPGQEPKTPYIVMEPVMPKP